MVNQDLSREIRRAVDTGKVEFGSRSTETTLLTSDCKMVIVSNNTPKSTRERLEHYCQLAGIPLVSFDGTSKELGQVCGKPFFVSTLSVMSEGQSQLLKTAKA